MRSDDPFTSLLLVVDIIFINDEDGSEWLKHLLHVEVELNVRGGALLENMFAPLYT